MNFCKDMLCKIDLLLFSATNGSLSIAEKLSPSNNEESSTHNRQFLIEIPGNLDISPAVIFRYLAEKFANMPNDQNEDVPANYLIRPTQATISLSNILDANGSRQMKSPMIHSPENSNSSSEVRFF
jgi:hypothetical protein